MNTRGRPTYVAPTLPSFELSSRPTRVPPTRFQGSKRKLVGWIGARLAPLQFDTALDAFGGTGSVSYELKRMGKAVTYNDVLQFNRLIGVALIENGRHQLTAAMMDRVVERHAGASYGDFVERTFGDIYFTDSENRWVDTAIQNIRRLSGRVRRAIAYSALFQSALAKRPYNLFHRANLYMRHADVTRSFGNKTSWDRPFEDHFRRFAGEINEAVFDDGHPCHAVSRDVIDVEGNFDLVYIDPPYTNAKGVGVNYRQFYHFLEGLTDYDGWSARVDWSSKHRRLIPTPDRWCCPGQLADAFEAVFQRFSDSTLVVSYRSDGIPSIEELAAMLKRYKKRVTVVQYRTYQYALSTNRQSKETLLIAE